MQLRFLKFREEDFEEYQSWFQDPDLNLHLGPMKPDDEWLHAVMHESNGCHYSAFQESALVAVVGITFPTTEHPSYCITDFAIRPDLRSQGLGSQVLSSLLEQYVLEAGQTWKTFIFEKNPRAKFFFEKNGWVCASKGTDKDGMIEMNLKN